MAHNIVGLELYAIVYQPGTAFLSNVQLGQQLQQHIAYIHSLDVQGILIQGAPYGDKLHSYPVVAVHSEVEAAAILSRDPDVAGHRLRGEVHRWHPKYGIYPPM